MQGGDETVCKETTLLRNDGGKERQEDYRTSAAYAEFFKVVFCVFSFPPCFCTFHASSLLEMKLAETFSTHACVHYSLQNAMKLLQYHFCKRGLCFMLQLPLLWQEGVPALSVPMEGHV